MCMPSSSMKKNTKNASGSNITIGVVGYNAVVLIISACLIYHNNGNDYIQRSDAFAHGSLSPKHPRTPVPTPPRSPSAPAASTGTKTGPPTLGGTGRPDARTRTTAQPAPPAPQRLHLFLGGGDDADGSATKEPKRRLHPMWKTGAAEQPAARWGIPPEVLGGLGDNTLKLPVPFRPVEYGPEAGGGGGGGVPSPPVTLVVRQLEEEDVGAVTRLCVQEYGSYPNPTPTSDNPVERMFLESRLVQYLEDLLFSFVVLTGMTQRVRRRRVGEPPPPPGVFRTDAPPPPPPDHNVLCLSETTRGGEETIVGMAELSLQPPDPTRTAPPFVLPTAVKNLISQASNVPPPEPYVSNVLVRDGYRGRGYGKVLMAACEGLAVEWGYGTAYLHVEAGREGVAQGLYRSLGYDPVPNKDIQDAKFGWMGPEVMYKGLYVVDGMALLYMKKDLVRPIDNKTD